MFCSQCGSQLTSDAKYCHVCGVTKGVTDAEEDSFRLSQPEHSRKRVQSTPVALSFDEYRERKGKERRSRFMPKKAKNEHGEKLNLVTIQIGLIRLKDGELKAVRGSNLPVKVLPTIGADELLKKGAEKMVKFNSDLNLCSPSSFTLLYPDRTEVKYLPGTTEPFTLQRYKEELGKGYGRITLFLCRTVAILDSLFLKSYYSDLSDSDTELPSYEEVRTVTIQLWLIILPFNF